MNEVDFSKVGLKMKQLRSERGITQEQVAKDLNCTVPFVSNVENNRAKLNLRVLLYYSKLCNVSVDTILDAGRDLPPLDEKERQLNDEVLNVFRGFSVAEKKRSSRCYASGRRNNLLLFISCIAIIHLHDLSSIYNIFHCMILYILITSINNLQVQLFLVSYFLSH